MTITVTIKTRRWPAMLTMTKHRHEEQSEVTHTVLDPDTITIRQVDHLSLISVYEVEPINVDLSKAALAPAADEHDD